MWNRWSSKTRREDEKWGGGECDSNPRSKKMVAEKRQEKWEWRKERYGGGGDESVLEAFVCVQSNICLSLYGSPLKWQLNKPVIFLRRLTSYTTGCMMVVCVCSLKCARWTNPVLETQIQMDSWEALCYCFPLAHKNTHICTLFQAKLMDSLKNLLLSKLTSRAHVHTLVYAPSKTRMS